MPVDIIFISVALRCRKCKRRRRVGAATICTGRPAVIAELAAAISEFEVFAPVGVGEVVAGGARGHAGDRELEVVAPVGAARMATAAIAELEVVVPSGAGERGDSDRLGYGGNRGLEVVA